MSTPSTYTGHPDFIPTNSSPIPVLSDLLGTFPIGATWGPVTVDVTSGGAYMIAVSPSVAADVTVTDVTVQHLDFKGNIVYEDFFGAVYAGNDINFGVVTQAPTILRGNVYGAQLKISGQVASQAWFNAVSGSSAVTVAPAVVNMYLLPNGIGDPDPKMSNGSAELLGIVGATPGNMLFAVNNQTLAPGTSQGPQMVSPISGPVVLQYRQNGLTTTATNFRFTLSFFTVVNGTTAFIEMPLDSGANLTNFIESINMPACMCVANWTNADGAQTTVVFISIVADKSA